MGLRALTGPAVVVDERGPLEGVITAEDTPEGTVGNISDADEAPGPARTAEARRG